jgi:hypothetical protein
VVVVVVVVVGLHILTGCWMHHIAGSLAEGLLLDESLPEFAAYEDLEKEGFVIVDMAGWWRHHMERHSLPFFVASSMLGDGRSALHADVGDCPVSCALKYYGTVIQSLR